MILEVAILDVISGEEKEFELVFAKAQKIISSMKGYLSHELQRCIEKSNRYILLVNWKTIEDHTVGFRESEQYQEWRKLLHHFYKPFPEVEHYEALLGSRILPEDCSGMEDIRKEIDSMDKQIIAILGKRFEYVKAASKFKTSEASVRAPERFKAMLQKRREWAEEEGLSPDAIEKMYEDLVNHFIKEEMDKWKSEE